MVGVAEAELTTLSTQTPDPGIRPAGDGLPQRALVESPRRLLDDEFRMRSHEIAGRLCRIVFPPRGLAPRQVPQLAHDAVRRHDIRANTHETVISLKFPAHVCTTVVGIEDYEDLVARPDFSRHFRNDPS